MSTDVKNATLNSKNFNLLEHPAIQLPVRNAVNQNRKEFFLYLVLEPDQDRKILLARADAIHPARFPEDKI